MFYRFRDMACFSVERKNTHFFLPRLFNPEVKNVFLALDVDILHA